MQSIGRTSSIMPLEETSYFMHVTHQWESVRTVHLNPICSCCLPNKKKRAILSELQPACKIVVEDTYTEVCIFLGGLT